MVGTQIVGADGVVRREQGLRREPGLKPRSAPAAAASCSSFAREPMIVVRRSALKREGRFDTTVGSVTETDMWVRLFSRYGVR
jgi:hypothetical protein